MQTSIPATPAALTPIGPDDIAILREYHASEMAVVAEAETPFHPLGEYAVPDQTSIGELAEMIKADPMRAALRWLNLEACVRFQQRHLVELERRIRSLHGSIR